MVAARGRGARRGRELIDRYRVDRRHVDPPGRGARRPALVELVFVVGTYTGLAMAFNSFGLELDADLASAVLPSGFDGVEEG